MLVYNHSNECIKLNLKKNIKINESIDEYDEFVNKFNNIMNRSKEFNRSKYKEYFLKYYNKKKYKFEITDNKLTYIINKWKKESNKVSKHSIFDHIYDNNTSLILRDYRNFYI